MSIHGELEMVNIGIMLAQSDPELCTFDTLDEVTEYLKDKYGAKIVRGMMHDTVYSIVKEAMKDTL